MGGPAERGAQPSVVWGPPEWGAQPSVVWGSLEWGAQRSGDWGPQKRGAQSESLKLMLGTNPKAAGEGARV